MTNVLIFVDRKGCGDCRVLCLYMKEQPTTQSREPLITNSQVHSDPNAASRPLFRASQPPSASSRSPSTILVFAAILVATLALFCPGLFQSARSAVPFFRPTASLARPISTGAARNIMPAKAENPNDPRWNSLAEGMDRFHAHFRYEFNRVYTLADGGFHKEGMSLVRFLREAQQLYTHLDMHHRIEETYIFPVLAKKMPQFKAGARESGEHLKSHKAIHDGLEKYETFLMAALDDSSKYDAKVLRAIMDGFREVLFRHLDEEVHDLGAESMKQAGWTLAEIRQIPM